MKILKIFLVKMSAKKAQGINFSCAFSKVLINHRLHRLTQINSFSNKINKYLSPSKVWRKLKN